MSLFCKIEDLENESDVEQKLIFPMLTAKEPIGLGYSESDFKTKIDIRKIKIGKGKEEKLYFPDYIIIINGIPTLLIEAKSPSENLDEAVREAMLYTTEINGQYESGFNPCSKIIVTNGREIWCNMNDEKEPKIKLDFKDINNASEKYDNFLKFASKKDNLIIWKEKIKKIRGNREYRRPTNLLGGKSAREEEYSNNRFGEELIFQYSDLFNPNNYEDRKEIAEKAYIESTSITSHKKFIGKIIRASKPSSLVNSREISDIKKPKEIFSRLKKHNECKGKIMLLIGNVGAGKSTFNVHLKEVALPADLKEEIVWLSLDLNNAPSSKDEIYHWIKLVIIKEIKNIYNEIDFDDIDFIKKIHNSEISKLTKKLEGLSSDKKYIETEIAKKVLELDSDIDSNIKAYINFFCNDKNKLLIITLDNCDKRGKETQLLMFEVSSWVKTEYNCLVFLPMRDVTYDHHRKEPPLDTVGKDLIFRIEPPDLDEVLYRRIKYIIGGNTTALYFNLKNGMKITFAEKDQEMFFKSMLHSLFNNNFFSKMVSGLAGRDIRKGIEIFLDFCKSGYITEEYYTKIVQSDGSYDLPPHLIMRVLIRGNRKYYIDDNSNIKNIFKCYPEDEMPDPYLRISILQWLNNNFSKKGPNNTRGYHKISTLLSALKTFGHEEGRIEEEIKKLVNARLITAESLIVNDENEVILEQIDEDELISIAPAGIIHLALLDNIEYLSSCAEDVWYGDDAVASRIQERMVKMSGILLATLENSKELINYLEKYKDIFDFHPEIYLKDDVSNPLVDLEICRKQINKIDEKISVKNKDYQPGEKINGQVRKIIKNGCIIDIPQAFGVAFAVELGDIKEGAKVEVEIVKFDNIRCEYLLKLVKEYEE